MSITGIFNNLLDKVGLYPPPWAMEDLKRFMQHEGNEDKLEKLLQSYPDATRWYYNNENPLAWALWHDNPAAAAKLIAADPELLKDSNAKGETPLVHAALTGNRKVIKFLAAHGADLKQADRDGNTVLHKLAAGESATAETIGLLVSLGADPKARNRSGATPLMTAAKSGSHVAAFYAHDRDITQRDGAGRTLVMAAAASKDPHAAIRFLAAEGADLDEKREADSSTALIQALAAGHAQAVTALMAEGAAVNPESPWLKGYIESRQRAGDLQFERLLQESPAKNALHRKTVKEKRDRVLQEEVESCTEGLDDALTVRPIRLKARTP